jgi:hypothetical protein
MKKIAGVIATAAAVAFVTAPLTATVASAHGSHKTHCYGVNNCKGKSSCKTAKNACKGKNSCKGQGMMMKSAKQCKKMGGTTEEPTS